MRSRADTLYARLALVLLVSLIAGFGTMYSVFRSHTDDQRIANLARTVSVQVRLVEEVLRTHPDFDKDPTPGVTLAVDPEDGGRLGEQAEFLAKLRRALDEELGRPVEMRGNAARAGGFWVRLSGISDGKRWLYFPAPARRRNHVEPWTWGLWSSFLVVLVGGMALLWGVQKPLRQLAKAIEQVGLADPPRMDVTGPRETRTLAEQFNNMVSRLKQFDRDRSEMLVGLAHDLRAPITRLRLQLEMETGQRRDGMIANLEGIDVIVDQFVAFAQGAGSEVPEKGRVAEFVATAVAPYRDRGVRLDAPAEADANIVVMPHMLGRALANLIENALEYGSSPVVVEIRRAAAEAVVRVIDHGVGIPPEKLDLAVQAFTRLDSARRGKGHCGLGLAIAARIARLHGGRLMLRQNAPSGLVAELHLPVAQEV